MDFPLLFSPSGLIQGVAPIHYFTQTTQRPEAEAF
jgi:hypothetical protein